MGRRGMSYRRAGGRADVCRRRLSRRYVCAACSRSATVARIAFLGDGISRATNRRRALRDGVELLEGLYRVIQSC